MLYDGCQRSPRNKVASVQRLEEREAGSHGNYLKRGVLRQRKSKEEDLKAGHGGIFQNHKEGPKR